MVQDGCWFEWLINPLTKKQRLKAIERSLNPDGDLSPKAVLALQMQFFDQQAEELTQELISALKRQSVRSEVLLNLYREMLQHRRDCCDVASKLIKYTAPALESVSVRQESETRFVIVSPPVIESTDEWLAKCKKDMASRAIKTDLDIDRAIESSRKQAVPTLGPIENFEDNEDDNPLILIPEQESD
jgi:hypothetical protein